MIHLFPRIKNRMLLLCACCIAFGGVCIIMNPAVNPAAILILCLIAMVLVILTQNLVAANVHNQLLARLYNQLDVEGFLKDYEPLLKISVKNPNVALTLRLHVSNAYCAQGRFDDAIELLCAYPLLSTGKQENDLLAHFAIVSNLCYCAEQKNDLENAQKHMDKLLDLKKQLVALQAAKPEKKRMAFSTELNEQCLKFLKTGKADIEELKKLVQNNTQQLHRITISLWVAQADLAINNRREAETLLKQIIKLAPDLYPGKAAAQLLASLPAKAEANA